MTTPLREFLDAKADLYNRPAFIAHDPICIPHQFSRPQDVEIMGFWAATLAWGQRKTIIAKARQLVAFMDGAPYDFVRYHQPADLKPFLAFRHRTFNDLDALYFLAFFQHYYTRHPSLEDAFLPPDYATQPTVEAGLRQFYQLFFSLPDAPTRTRKHVATPTRGSACKRLCMFLRWMVRRDDRGVDFGLWQRLHPHQLVCPCDVHSARVARHLGLITRQPTDWHTALQLTENLRRFDPTDPVRYDFALFGLGVEGHF